MAEMTPSRHNRGRFAYRRLLAVLAAGAAALAILSVPATVSAAGTKQFRLFSPNSVWNHPLAPNARIDPRSPQMVAGLLQEVRREQTAGVGPWIQTDSYSTPLYIAGPHQRLVRVALDDPTASWRVGLQKAFNKVPIPSYARPAAGSA
ncbi:MAG: hypothetical protein ACRDLL_15975 [Solirubrobacterales bacterium]